VFLLLPKQKSTIFVKDYLLCFQSSAARPQGRAEKWCRCILGELTETGAGRVFGGFALDGRRMGGGRNQDRNVKKMAETATDAGFSEPTSAPSTSLRAGSSGQMWGTVKRSADVRDRGSGEKISNLLLGVASNAVSGSFPD
jgi:hypothetical protein